ncbi:transposable element Tcb2 transposase [Trichonephila clavipes]|nr:transposable element Tcb2 transposase [Trichonephila clavipes]
MQDFMVVLQYESHSLIASIEKKRLSFAKEHISKPESFWNTVIFSDESKFNLYRSDGQYKVWRQVGKELDPKNTIKTVKYGGESVLVWGCMSAGGVGELVFIGGIMDKMVYLEILKNNLQKSAVNVGLGSNFIFQQANDPKHTVKIVKLYVLYHCKKELHTPPQSPDLNVIENLWPQLEKSVHEHTITSKEVLKNVLKEEWTQITVETTKKIVKSMPKRLQAVIKAKVDARQRKRAQKPEGVIRNLRKVLWASGFLGTLNPVSDSLIDEMVFMEFSCQRLFFVAIGRAAAGQWAGLQGLELGFWKIFWRKEFSGERVFLLVPGKILSTFFGGWLKELEINSFEILKDLIKADQIKKCPPDYKNHFLNTWEKLNDPVVLAEKLDSYSTNHRWRINA